LRVSLVAIVLVAAVAALRSQEQAAIFVFAVDRGGVPLLEIKPSDLAIQEDAGRASIVSVRRFGWPLKITVLVDNGPRTKESLVHFRTGLKRFFGGLPPNVPVSLIATAPNPRWLIREATDRVQIERAVNLIAPDEGLARFSDALIEYAARLDEEFSRVSKEEMPPYLPVLVSIATTHQDGSQVTRQTSLKMLTSLRQHLVWTNMIMVSPVRAASSPGGLPVVDIDEGQNAEIAKAVQEVTAGRYVPVTGSGTSALMSTILPELAQSISARYIRQMTQHRVVLERAAGARGPMRNVAVSLFGYQGAKIVISVDGSMP
jgi:hypothetical protein